MTVRWMTTGASNGLKKKLRVRDKPVKPKSLAPKQKSIEHTQRAPKLRKPVVERPFVDSALSREAYSGEDMSESELELLESGEGGPILSIEWVADASERCDGIEGRPGVFCRSLGGRSWRGLRPFLAGRTIATAPNGKSVGMYGYSHPGCKCRLRVTTSDGNITEVGPYS